MAREGGGEREGECDGKNFATYSHGEVRGGGMGRGFFLVHYFSGVFFVKETLHVLELRHIKACF